MDSRPESGAQHYDHAYIKRWQQTLTIILPDELEEIQKEIESLDKKIQAQESALALLQEKLQTQAYVITTVEAVSHLHKVKQLIPLLTQSHAEHQSELGAMQRHRHACQLNLAMNDTKLDLLRRKLRILELREIIDRATDETAKQAAEVELKTFLPIERQPTLFTLDRYGIEDAMKGLNTIKTKWQQDINRFKHECQLLEETINKEAAELKRLESVTDIDRAKAAEYLQYDWPTLCAVLERTRKEQEENQQAEKKIIAFLASLKNQREEYAALQALRLEELASLKANLFLIELRDDAKELLARFVASLESIRHLFLDRHPAKNTLNTRHFLAKLEMAKKAILAKGNPKEQYYQSLGLLWSNHQHIEDHELRESIQTILFNNKLSPIDCLNAYSLWKQETNFTEISEEQVGEAEHETFQNACQAVRAQLATVPRVTSVFRKVHDQANEVLKRVTETVEMSRRLQYSCDVLYHTQILNQTTALLADPGNLALHVKYRRLAQFDQAGKPSTTRKVMGAMLLFLGAVLLTAGTLLLLATLGVSLPFSMLSVIAASIMTAKLGIATTSTTSVLALGGGFGLFYWGTRRGLSNTICNLQDGVMHASTAPLFVVN